MSHSSSAAGGTFGPANSGPPNSSNTPAFSFGLPPPKPTKGKGRDREEEGEDELDEHPFAAAVGQPPAQPGMPAGAGGNSDPDAPEEEDMYASLTSQALNADGTPKRPMNAFMIFARRRRPQVSAENSALRTGEISKLLSKEWNGMAKGDKQFYLDQAKKLKDAFNLRYPDYVYKRRPNNSRKKRRTDYSTGLPSASTSKLGDQDNSLDEDDDASPDGLETPLSGPPSAPYPPTNYSYDTPEYPSYNYYSAQGAASTNGASGQGQQTSPVVATVRAAHSWDNTANVSGPSSVASSDSLHHPAHSHHHPYHPPTEASENSDGLWMKDRSTAHSQPPAPTWGPPLTSPATSAATSLSDLQLATGRRLHLNTHSSRPQSPKHESYTPPLPNRPWSNPPPPPPSSTGTGTASNSVPPSPSSSTYAHANHYPTMTSSYYPSPSSANPSSAPPSAAPGGGQGSQYFSQLQYVSARQQAYDPHHHAHPQAAYLPHDPNAGSNARHEPPEAYWRSQQHASGT